jgi:hypothetical protein
VRTASAFRASWSFSLCGFLRLGLIVCLLIRPLLILIFVFVPLAHFFDYMRVIG